MPIMSPQPKRIDTPRGRYYSTMYGTFPSVTTVLGATKSADASAKLENWQARTLNSAQITKEACDRGTCLHNRIERHLNGLPPEDYSVREKQLGVPHVWKSVQGHLSRIHNPRHIEVCVYDPKAGFAGTLDLLEETANGELELWDWKNSLRPKQFEWIEDYCCQAAAYAKAAPKCLPHLERPISRCRIIIALQTGPAQEFVLTESKIDYYYKFFLRRLSKFQKLGEEYSYTPPTRPVRRRTR